MGFANGTLSVRRYYVDGKVPKDLSPALVRKIAENAFGSFKPNAAATDDVEYGWVCPTHLFDGDFQQEKIQMGTFLHLWMRLDNKRIPANVLRSYVRQEESAAWAAHGRALTRDEIKEAREIALGRAEKETREGRYRRMSAVPLLWDLRNGGTLYTANMAGTALECLESLFTNTFGCRLQPANARAVAARTLSLRGSIRSLEDAAPFHLVNAPDGNGSADVNHRDGRFLGREFLSWVWYRSDQNEGTFEVASDTVAVAIHKWLRMECDFRQSGAIAITGDGPTQGPEARAALTTGKQPSGVGLIVGSRKGEWSFNLNGESMTLSSLTLPERDEPVRTARIEARFRDLGDVFQMLDGLYSLFLTERMSDGWSASGGRMRRWAQGMPMPARQPRLITA